MNVTILRCTGQVEQHNVSEERVFDEVKRLIGAELLDTVNLHDGRVMLVDDLGYETITQESTRNGVPYVTLVPIKARKPDNARATDLYLATCKPGVTHRIVGDAAIVRDSDFTD